MRRPRVLRAAEVQAGDLVNLDGQSDIVLGVSRSGHLVLLETKRFMSVGVDAARLVLILRAC